MPAAPPRARPSRRAALPALLPALLVALALGASGPATAQPAPADQGDAVLQLLHQRGLLPAPDGAVPEPSALTQVRNAASDAVLAAMNFIGTPYRRGGNDAQGFDCSGFTRHVFEMSLGRVLPRRADEQARDGSLLAVDRSELRPGDLVFFNTLRRAFSHVGIYIGDGRFIHAPRSGTQVRIEDMRTAYWARRYNGARRADVVAPAGSDAAAAPR